MSAHPAPLALTPGDPCGIGPEVVARLWCEHPAQVQGCLVVGDVGLMQRALALLGPSPVKVQAIGHPAQAWQVPAGTLPVLPLGSPWPVLPWGAVDARAGRLAASAVQWAAQAALRGEVAGLVTAPLHKEALHLAGAPWSQYPGHTELLQAECAAHAGVPLAQMPVRMMLANRQLRTVLVSIHVPLRQALQALSVAGVLETLRITHQALLPLLGRAPRIAVAGVNPHAGEGGLFGHEEAQILVPALAQARAAGWDVHGPLAPDTVFMRARHSPPEHPGEFDVVVAMYHDQGLIPVKYLGVEEGVNVTLGLPILRTSPDHGTAMDIAGQGRADGRSMAHALAWARRALGWAA